MPVIRNINPVGDVDVPLLRREGRDHVARGAEVEVTQEHADILLEQADNWALVDTSGGVAA